MGGHRRDQSDSHVPLRPCSDFSVEGHELQVRKKLVYSLTQRFIALKKKISKEKYNFRSLKPAMRSCFDQKS